jgi:drug/metabolite transporter (DMT)-like permease
MKTKTWAIVLVLLTTLLTSTAQLLWKKGSATLEFTPLSIATNYFLIGGILLYLIGGTMMILSFRGGEVSVLYPIIATSYIWVALLSARFLGEDMNALKLLGISSIIIGIIFIGFGSKNSVPGAM